MDPQALVEQATEDLAALGGDDLGALLGIELAADAAPAVAAPKRARSKKR